MNAIQFVAGVIALAALGIVILILVGALVTVILVTLAALLGIAT